VLLGVANFYWRFIWKYSKVTASILTLLQTKGTWNWEWTQDAKLAFRKLKKTFLQALIPPHFILRKPIILQTNAGGFTITGNLNQFNRFRIL